MINWTPSDALDWNFGLAWTAFVLVVALHVWDEAAHDFLTLYNPNALALRRRYHVPVPVFTLRVWIGSLTTGITVLFLLSPFAFQGVHWLRVVALPLALIVGLFNAGMHIIGSLIYHQRVAGVLTSPLLLMAGSWLLWSSWEEVVIASWP